MVIALPHIARPALFGLGARVFASVARGIGALVIGVGITRHGRTRRAIAASDIAYVAVETRSTGPEVSVVLRNGQEIAFGADVRDRGRLRLLRALIARGVTVRLR